jgi:hypothetical protein
MSLLAVPGMKPGLVQLGTRSSPEPHPQPQQVDVEVLQVACP